ncbi:hypothetical protein BH20VER3_BH20VER3_12920 [soil metagenome]
MFSCPLGREINLPEPVIKIPHPDVVFRPLRPVLVTPFWIARREEDRTPALQAHVDVVAQFDRRLRGVAATSPTRSGAGARMAQRVAIGGAGFVL